MAAIQSLAQQLTAATEVAAERLSALDVAIRRSHEQTQLKWAQYLAQADEAFASRIVPEAHSTLLAEKQRLQAENEELLRKQQDMARELERRDAVAAASSKAEAGRERMWEPILQEMEKTIQKASKRDPVHR